MGGAGRDVGGCGCGGGNNYAVDLGVLGFGGLVDMDGVFETDPGKEEGAEGDVK